MRPQSLKRNGGWGSSARELITYSKARKGCTMSEKKEKNRLVTFWKPRHRKRHCCRNCHFLSKYSSSLSDYPWDQEDRDECRPRNREDLLQDYRVEAVGCYKSIWSKEYDEFVNGSERQSLKREILKNRSESCFFVEYHAGMEYRIAEELFRVRYDTRQLKRSLSWTIKGLLVAAFSSLFSIGLQLYNTFWNSNTPNMNP